MSTSWQQDQHPRSDVGQFATKRVAEPSGGLQTLHVDSETKRYNADGSVDKPPAPVSAAQVLDFWMNVKVSDREAEALVRRYDMWPDLYKATTGESVPAMKAPRAGEAKGLARVAYAITQARELPPAEFNKFMDTVYPLSPVDHRTIREIDEEWKLVWAAPVRLNPMWRVDPDLLVSTHAVDSYQAAQKSTRDYFAKQAADLDATRKAAKVERKAKRKDFWNKLTGGE